MKGKWKVTSNSINGVKMYAAYRLIDVRAVDHSGNREYGSEYGESRDVIQQIVDKLNAPDRTTDPT